MNGGAKFPFPLHLLVLDGVGALIFALGAAGHFGNVQVLARLLPRPDVNLEAMVLGGVMMVIAMAGIVKATLERARQRSR